MSRMGVTIERLLAGPPVDAAAESLAQHRARLGDLPWLAPRDLIDEIDATGLLGRGGAGFPVARKWRTIAGRPTGRAVVVVNGAEGEPASHKDRLLMAHRPHLIIDGAILAAEAIGADEIIFYVGSEHLTARRAIGHAVDERRHEIDQRVRLFEAPPTYVAGEASAAVNAIDTGQALPLTKPPSIAERGVDGAPTLVQNVESLAYVALIARGGADWYRSAGLAETPGTALVTLSGAAAGNGVREIELGSTLRELTDPAGAGLDGVRAVLVGGYFGTWATALTVRDLPLDPAVLSSVGLTFGCGMVGLLREDECGVAITAAVMSFLADERAGRCGPCVHGLASIGDATRRVAQGEAGTSDLVDIERWTGLVRGRGACHHPDGAAQLMASAFDVFGDEFLHHARTGRCSVADRRVEAPHRPDLHVVPSRTEAA